MTPQALQTLSQIAVTVGGLLATFGGFGLYVAKQRIDSERAAIARPIVDLCNRGISVTASGNGLLFDIPYCSGKNSAAFNVKLRNAVALQDGDKFVQLSGFGNAFPDGITLTYETGKTMTFKLSPLTPDILGRLYIAVRGTFTNESGKSSFSVFDIFKYNASTKEWMRTLGPEDARARAYFQSLPDQD